MPIGVGTIAMLLAGNLRGVRQAGAQFAAPAYAFIIAMFALVTAGLIGAAGRGFHPVPTPRLPVTEAVGALLLRAFSSGSTAMTGIEAISNAVVVSPHRTIVAPPVNYIAVLHYQRPELTITVILPEIVVRHWWQRILHYQIAPRLRRAPDLAESGHHHRPVPPPALGGRSPPHHPATAGIPAGGGLRTVAFDRAWLEVDR